VGWPGENKDRPACVPTVEGVLLKGGTFDPLEADSPANVACKDSCIVSLFLLLQLQLLLLLLTMLPLLFKLFNSLLEGGGQAQGA